MKLLDCGGWLKFPVLFFVAEILVVGENSNLIPTYDWHP